MASLYKKPVVVTDPKSGERVKTKSRKWWGRYRDALGRDRRVPLARDKAAAQAMLNEIVLKAEREAAGQLDPFEDHAKRPLTEHVDRFEQHLRDKGGSDQHVGEVATKVRKIIAGCKWKFIRDISPSGTQRHLAELRADGLSVQTTNHYLRAAKQFSRWLVRDRRTSDDRLAHLSMMNVKVDRRHDRRALSPDEFALLVEAAKAGPPIESLPAPPVRTGDAPPEAAVLRATGTDDGTVGVPAVPTVVPRGAENGAIRLASNEYETAPDCTEDGRNGARRKEKPVAVKRQRGRELRTNPPQPASPCIAMPDGGEESTPRRGRTCNLRFRRPTPRT